ncbi:MAG: hypothetical protein QM537_03490 [Candidatus Symbiobacter sp.]|nr:hypothetical protein [Candidatus Symbiobacter sp.]
MDTNINTNENGSFYIVFVHCRDGLAYKKLENIMDKALSWYRFNDTTWVVYSKKSADELASRYADLVNDGGNLFINKLDAHEREGLMDKGFWQWLQQPIDKMIEQNHGEIKEFINQARDVSPIPIA